MKLYPLAIALLLSVPALQCMEDDYSKYTEAEEKELTVKQKRGKLQNVLKEWIEDHKAWVKVSELKTEYDPNLIIPGSDAVGERFRKAQKLNKSITPDGFITNLSKKEVANIFKEYIADL